MCKIKQKSNKVFFVPNPVQTDAKYKKIVLNQRLEIFGLESKIHISQLTIYTNLSHRCIKMCIVTFLRYTCESKARIKCHITDIPIPKSSDVLNEIQGYKSIRIFKDQF